MRNECRLIQRIEQFVQCAHVPGKAPLQPARSFIGKLKAAHAGPQLQCFLLLTFIQLAQLEDGRGVKREPRSGSAQLSNAGGAFAATTRRPSRS